MFLFALFNKECAQKRTQYLTNAENDDDEVKEIPETRNAIEEELFEPKAKELDQKLQDKNKSKKYVAGLNHGLVSHILHVDRSVALLVGASVEIILLETES